MPRVAALFAVLALAVAVDPAAAATDRASAAALQAALHGRGLYDGTIDGIVGPATASAVVRLQVAKRLAPDGVAGPATLRALGWRGGPRLGRRVLQGGRRGFDVAALQFLLARAGFPSGPVDGRLGARTDAALRRFQAWAGLGADGLAGDATLAALRRPPPRSPVTLRRPVEAAVGDRFGPRGAGLHSGIDYPAARGAVVRAAAAGCVVTARPTSGGYGRLVVLQHAGGVSTWYAHLSRISVDPGTCVAAGAILGRVGTTGHSTGPHLHFEVRVRDAVVDPASAGL